MAEKTEFQQAEAARREAAQQQLANDITAAVERFKDTVGRHHDVHGVDVLMAPFLDDWRVARVTAILR
jgi:hypothetical protein